MQNGSDCHSVLIVQVQPPGLAFLVLTYLGEAAPGPLDSDLALVVDGGPDVDGLAGHVAAPVQPHPARDRPRGEAGHAQLVLDLAVKRLLKIST